MSSPVAIGVGCRRGIDAASVLALVRAALVEGKLAPEAAGLFTIADKRDETGLVDAANLLGLSLCFIPREVLAKVGTPTQSGYSWALFGVSSVAEAAALAGAGEGGTLVVPRMVGTGVTCAIARARA